VRNNRKKTLDEVKKLKGSISEDESKRFTKEVSTPRTSFTHRSRLVCFASGGGCDREGRREDQQAGNRQGERDQQRVGRVFLDLVGRDVHK